MYFNILTLFLAVSFAAGNVLPVHRQPHPGHRKPGGRVVGGHEAPITNFPFQVSIQAFGLHNCGGSIINENTIITAGHCIDGFLSLFYEVVAGATVLADANVVRIPVSKSIVHENYVEFDYDIAIIKLSQNLTFSDSISPVKLPQNDEGLPDGTIVNVTGYGNINDWEIFGAGKLYAGEVQLVNQDECAKDYAEFTSITERMMCAGVPEGGIDACQGDSGGPLSHDGTLIGVVSWGYGCGVPGYPGVYTRVSSLVSWINEHIDE